MRKFTRMLSIILITAFAFCMIACSKTTTKDENNNDANNAESTEDTSNLLIGKHHVIIEVSNYGSIYAELDADVAPITVTNFINLAKDGFYDGLTFHRVVDGFMIQGGDPNKNGTGGSSTTIKGEFKNNGIENSISHKRGTISMARNAGNMNSASSQFFIMLVDKPGIDGDYAAFGTVTEGMEIVDKICADTKKLTNANGLISITSKQPVITTIRVVD